MARRKSQVSQSYLVALPRRTDTEDQLLKLMLELNSVRIDRGHKIETQSFAHLVVGYTQNEEISKKIIFNFPSGFMQISALPWDEDDSFYKETFEYSKALKCLYHFKAWDIEEIKKVVVPIFS